MSLQYVVDAYNLINHPRFEPERQSVNIQYSLANFIRTNKLSGSKNNEVILVFDGYPPATGQIPKENGLSCVFSQEKEADELIKKIVESSHQPRNIIVVTDDKEVQIVSRFLQAKVSSVEEFICGKENKRSANVKFSDLPDSKLGYSAMQKINAELKKKWL